MTVVATQLVDDTKKVIVKVTGAHNEEENIVYPADLKNATSEAKVSISDVKYEVKGGGNLTLEFDGKGEKLEITGIDNYGLKPEEEKIEGEGNIKVKSDANVSEFKFLLECEKESGYE